MGEDLGSFDSAPGSTKSKQDTVGASSEAFGFGADSTGLFGLCGRQPSFATDGTRLFRLCKANQRKNAVRALRPLVSRPTVQDILGFAAAKQASRQTVRDFFENVAKWAPKGHGGPPQEWAQTHI